MRSWLLAVLVAVSVAPRPAEARAASVLRYPPTQVWNAAVRMIRVDLGYELQERDPGAGYLLFTYRDNRRSSPASMELVRVGGDGRPTKVIFRIREMPRYHELNLIDRLTRKLRQEYGDPPRVRRPSRSRRDAGSSSKRSKGSKGSKRSRDAGP